MFRRIWTVSGRHGLLAWKQIRRQGLITKRTGICLLEHPSRETPWVHPSLYLSRSAAARSTQQNGPKDSEIHPEILAELNRRGIQRGKVRKGEFRSVCPKCKGGSTREISLACKVADDGFVWYCHRATCGDNGAFYLHDKRGPTYAKPDVALEALDDHWKGFFRERGINQDTLERNRIAQDKTGNLAFPYFRGGELVNIKFRVRHKKAFYQCRDTEKILYAWDDIVGQEEVIIVEGEVDKLAMEEAGFFNVTSIPEGAPAKVQAGPLPAPSDDTKFVFLWNSQPALKQAQRLLLAVDNDEPGRVLAEELARRLGPEICWLVSWSVPPIWHADQRKARSQLPGSAAGAGEGAGRVYKDANEVLLAEGPQAIKDCIDAARPFPVPGLKSIDSFADGISNGQFIHQQPSGLSLGLKGFDELYAVKPGVVTVITGAPLSGKSEFATSILQRLSRHNFPAAVCLLEGQDTQKAVARMLEKHTGAPLQQLSRSPSLMRQGLESLSQSICIVDPGEPLAASLLDVLNLVRIASKRYNLKGVVLDSFQGFHPYPRTTGEAAAFVRQIRDFAKQHSLHVWIVSHCLNSFLDKDLLLPWADVGLTIQRTNQGCFVGVRSNQPMSARSGSIVLSFESSTGRFDVFKDQGSKGRAG